MAVLTYMKFNLRLVALSYPCVFYNLHFVEACCISHKGYYGDTMPTMLGLGVDRQLLSAIWLHAKTT